MPHQVVHNQLGQPQLGHADGVRRPGEPTVGAKGRLRDLAQEISGQIAAVDSRRPMDDVGQDWDAVSAEALTRMYEHEGVAQTVYYADPPVAAQVLMPAAAVAPAFPVAPNIAPAVVSVAAPVLADLAHDRAWLDGRFADLAQRLDDTMRRFDPAERLAPIGSRLDRIEGNLSAALDDLVRRDAFAGLETQVGDVKAQLSVACAKLARLDGIEAELGHLTALARAASDAPSDGGILAATSPFDLDALVQRTADRTAERLATVPHHGVAPEAVGELKALVSGYVAEYRREQSQTSAVLATMQDALVRLIDRIEQYDEEMEPSADQVADATPAERFVEVDDERSPQPGRRTSDQSQSPAPAMAAVAPPQTVAPTVRAQSIAVDTGAPSARPVRKAAASAAPIIVAPDPVIDAATAAEAMAAERARVAAERAALAAGSRRTAPVRPSDAPPLRAAAPAAKGVASVAAEQPEAPTAEDQATEPRAKRVKPAAKDGHATKRGLMVAGIAALLIGASTFAHLFISGRLTNTAKMEDRAPVAAPASAGPKMTPRPQPAAQRIPPPQPATRDATAPQAAPAPLELPAEFKPKTVPETATDDLSANRQPGQPAPSLAAAAAMRPSQAAVQGITLDNGALPDPAELARRMQAPGSAQATPAQPAAQPINAVVQPEADTAPRSVELPPATIGPMSLRISAQQGDPSAQFEVAARFAEGKGVKQDFPLAITWYTRAAQKGFVPAQYRLATLYERGLGTTADVMRAKVWYRRAADQGNIKSMHNLAVLAAGPQQAEPDYPTAARWFTEAAERGLADSQFNLGVLSENGLGIDKDQQQAYKWFALAARSGDKEATRRRDQLLASFTPDQAKAAELVVANWRSKPTDMKANDVRSAGQAWQAEQQAAQQAAQQKLAEAQQRQAAQQPQSQPQQQQAPQAPAAKATPVKASKLIAKP